MLNSGTCCATGGAFVAEINWIYPSKPAYHSDTSALSNPDAVGKAGTHPFVPGRNARCFGPTLDSREAVRAPLSRPEIHLRIGRLLIESMGPGEIAESIFDVVNQLNRAVDLTDDPAERLSLLRLNVIAGMKAKASIAYTSARNYFALAEALLSPDAWAQRYQETIDFYLAFSECEYLIANFVAASY
jgi:hypothetical protein